MRRACAMVMRPRCTPRFVCGLAVPARPLLSSAAPKPPSPNATANTTSSDVKPDPFDPESIATEFKVDAKAAEQMRLAQELGEEVFEENTDILKKLAMRGLRAFLVAAIGLGTFGIVMKRKKRREEAEKPDAEASTASSEAEAEADDIDPTQRYLEEMRGLGFDVDTLEEELAAEKASASKKSKKVIA